MVHDSPEFFDEIAKRLTTLGVDAYSIGTGGGIICISVKADKYELWFGTANDIWGFDVMGPHANNGEFNEELTHKANQYLPIEQASTDSENMDLDAVAAAIKSMTDIFVSTFVKQV